jgi:hypothetical protein
MDIGMLWKDDDARRSLEEKVARAADYYRSKYGEQPTVCFVHPSMLPDGGEASALNAAGLRVLTARTVQVNHFWLGVNHIAEARSARVKERAS